MIQALSSVHMGANLDGKEHNVQRHVKRKNVKNALPLNYTVTRTKRVKDVKTQECTAHSVVRFAVSIV